MSGDNDGIGGEGGDGRREWPADYRVAFAELLVEFKELEGRVNTSEARTETGFSDMKAAIAQLGKDAAERDVRAAEAAAERDVRAAEAAAERDVRASDRETRLVKWMVALIAIATGIIVAVK